MKYSLILGLNFRRFGPLFVQSTGCLMIMKFLKGHNSLGVPSIKLLKQGLARICAGKIEGRKNWPDSLPKLIQTINSYFPYKSIEITAFSIQGIKCKTDTKHV